MSAVNSSFNGGQPFGWWSVASQFNGMYVVAAGEQGVLFSNDHGANFNQLIYSEAHVNALDCGWTQCNNLFLATNTTIMMSRLYSAAWVAAGESLPITRYVSVACDASGFVVLAAPQYGQLYLTLLTQTDTVVWQPTCTSVVAHWSKVIVSDSGAAMAACSLDQGVFLSVSAGLYMLYI